MLTQDASFFNSMIVTHPENEGKSIRVRGVVQGVSFRPFVYRLATEEQLARMIGKDTDGVIIELDDLRRATSLFSFD